MAVAALLVGAGSAQAAVHQGSDLDYHAEGQIVDGQIHIVTARSAPAISNPCRDAFIDPRNDSPTVGAHPDACNWGTPAGSGQDFTHFVRHIPDAETSPNGSFVPASNPDTLEGLDGHAGFEDPVTDMTIRGHFAEDEDMHFTLAPLADRAPLDAYLAPDANPDSPWRRFCGVGVVDELNTGQGTPNPLAPFAIGQQRKFLVEVFDEELIGGSPSGPNRDYWVIDIFAPGSSFDTQNCGRQAQGNPVTPPGVNPIPGVTPRPRPGGPAVLPAIVLPAPSARLRAPSGCVPRAFNATVTGRRIRHVDFFLDGRRIARVTRRDSSGAYRVRIDPRRLRAGTHRIIARAQFVSGSAPTARVLTASFLRCAKAAQKPAFTG